MKPAAKMITVFGSGRAREGDEPYAQARVLGAALASKGFGVCSGGYGGVMEAVSRGAKEAGGRTLGVTAQFFPSLPNRWIDEEVRVNTWQDRLWELIERGRGYVACPGGTGTLVELAVVWEMLNKGAMTGKPLVVLGDFWQPVIDRVREVETGHPSRPGESGEPLIHAASSAEDAALYLVGSVKTARSFPATRQSG
jgi:uncharacterized protein (TIGR00730 family)